MRASSSIADDVWHADTDPGAYEWWYFDALSHDGRDALVIIFLAGFLFSPGYNRAVRQHLRGRLHAAPRPTDHPAIAICHYRDGRPQLRTVAEYDRASFDASTDHPACRIGRNGFRLETDANGNRSYVLSLAQTLRGGRQLEAALTWSVKEGDLWPAPNGASGAAAMSNTHSWNLVAPRCKVTGTISVVEKGGGKSAVQTFNGLGYHDHNRDRRWIPQTVDSWQWGRAHFSSATAVFYRFHEKGAVDASARLFMVEENTLEAQQANLQEMNYRRDLFGLRYPGRVRFETHDGQMALTIVQARVIDRSFFYLRFLSEAMLEMKDGHRETAFAITEHLAPETLAWPALWWLINMRIGRGDDRASFLP